MCVGDVVMDIKAADLANNRPLGAMALFSLVLHCLLFVKMFLYERKLEESAEAAEINSAIGGSVTQGCPPNNHCDLNKVGCCPFSKEHPMHVSSCSIQRSFVNLGTSIGVIAFQVLSILAVSQVVLRFLAREDEKGTHNLRYFSSALSNE